MNTFDSPSEPQQSQSRPQGTRDDSSSTGENASRPSDAAIVATEEPEDHGPRVGTVVWGLVIIALATLIVISKLGIVALNGTYVLIGLMLGAGAALVVGGLISMRRARQRGSQS